MTYLNKSSRKRRYYSQQDTDLLRAAVRELIIFHNTPMFTIGMDYREANNIRYENYQLSTKVANRLETVLRGPIAAGEVDTISYVNKNETVIECGRTKTGNFYVQLKGVSNGEYGDEGWY